MIRVRGILVVQSLITIAKFGTMSTVKVPRAEMECSRWCRSKQHGAALASTLTLRGISSSAFISYLKWLCGNCGHVIDIYGRTALHIAASCGLKDVVVWLVKHSDANVNAKDTESGYTPLHRSIFYGQIHVATRLIQLGANLGVVDYDDLTAIDHVMKDRLPLVEYSLCYPCEVYVWGTNSNYTLGIGTQQCRSQPELLDSFRKQGISIKQVAMHKFHSVFVSHDGRVFSCGHGQGGRLGLESEKAVLSPQQLKLGYQSGTHSPEVCCAVSLGRDHTVLLMESGIVMTCGLNAHHQLGHTPPPSYLTNPRAISHKSVKSIGPILGVSAARFHTVIWASKAVLTFGLHAGQLGYSKGPGTTQIAPKLVSALSHKDHEITHVVASDGATVVAVKKGDIYVLHEYQCRKIASKQLDIVKLAVVGGHLDSKVDTNILMDQGGEQLKIAVLTSTGKLLLWQESSQQLIRCLFSLNRPLVISDVAINRSQLLLVTRDGESFEGELKIRKHKKHVHSPQQESGRLFHDFVDREDCEMVKVKRLPHIHRAVTITSELKGRNCAIIQTHPKAALVVVPQVETSDMKEQMMSLLQEAQPEDFIHDVIFQVGLREFLAHRFIIASRSEHLAKLIREQLMQSGASKKSVPRVKISHVLPEIFEQILQFIYANDCPLIRPGVCPIKIDACNTNENNKDKVDLDNSSDSLGSLSAFELYSQDAHRKKHKNSQTNEQIPRDPVRLAQEAAKRFGIYSLRKRLERLRYEDGYIRVTERGSYLHEKPIFHLKEHQDLYDVTVKSEEGREIRAHKCILTARLEYLYNMLSHGWVENSENVCLRLPAPYSVLELLIEFLYEDNCEAIHAAADMDLVSHTLIVADQLFAKRLKEMCEVALAGMLTLRNVAEMLQFAHTYNAIQLKNCCMQYVCLNLAALLECRMLEILSEDILQDLSKYYCNSNPKLSRRVITPYSDAPSQSQVEAVAEAYPASWQDEEDTDVTDIASKKSIKTKKKLRPRKISTSEVAKGNERVRNESISSNLSYNSEDGDSTKGLHSLNFDEVIEKSSDNVTLNLSKVPANNSENSPWVKVNKNQKVLQARLKAITAVKETPSLVNTVEETFTRLSPKRSTPIKCPSRQSEKTKQQSSPCQGELYEPATSPPDLVLDFPVLQYSPPIQPDSSARTHHKTGLNHLTTSSESKKPTKMSQRQRMKLAAEMNSGTLGDQLDQLNHTTRPAWEQQVSEVGHGVSFMDVMQAELQKKKHHSSTIETKKQPSRSQPASNPWFRTQPASSCSPKQVSEEAVNFTDVVADEKKKQRNWSKMRSKPLELTQIEDQAIEDLLVFYNAAGATDEKITVRRVVTEDVAPPVWITSHHSHQSHR